MGAAPAAPPTVAQVDQPKQDEKDEEKDEKDKDSERDDPWALDIPEFASTGFEGFIAGSALAGLYDTPTMFDQLLMEPVVEPESVSELLADMMTSNMEMDFIFDTPPLLVNTPYEFVPQEPMGAIVPAPGVFAFLPFVVWLVVGTPRDEIRNPLLLMMGCSSVPEKPTTYTVGLGSGDLLGVLTYYDLLQESSTSTESQ